MTLDCEKLFHPFILFMIMTCLSVKQSVLFDKLKSIIILYEVEL